MSALSKPIGTTTMYCLSRVSQVQLTVIQTSWWLKLSMRVTGLASHGQSATADTCSIITVETVVVQNIKVNTVISGAFY